MFIFWTLIGIASFVIFFLVYNLYDLWSFEDDFEITKKAVAIHLGILTISAALWPVTWLFVAVSLLTGFWESFAGWYRRTIAEQLINRI